MKNVVVESLSSPGCHNCGVFEEFWHSVSANYPNAKYENKDLFSPEGAIMAEKYGIMASPGIVINGELFSVGGVDKDKFINKIKALSS